MLIQQTKDRPKAVCGGQINSARASIVRRASGRRSRKKSANKFPSRRDYPSIGMTMTPFVCKHRHAGQRALRERSFAMTAILGHQS
jgi:hypothetical protein